MLLLRDFHTYTGLKLNKDKTEAIFLGNSNFNLAKYGITIAENGIKILGITLNRELLNIENINFCSPSLPKTNIARAVIRNTSLLDRQSV